MAADPNLSAFIWSVADLLRGDYCLRKARLQFVNTSPLDMGRLMADKGHIRENLFAYIQAFSPSVRDVFDAFTSP
jgi:hypothetical protein